MLRICAFVLAGLEHAPDMSGIKDLGIIVDPSAAPQAAAVAAKDAWYTGPDTITQDGKTYHRLPSEDYATATGPRIENSKIVRAILKGLIAHGPIRRKDMRWIFPFAPELVFYGLIDSYPHVVFGHEQLYGIKCWPSIGKLHAIHSRDGKDVTADVIDEVKAGKRKFGFLGNSSAEQPILFIEERVYNDLYKVPSMLAATVKYFDDKGGIPITSVSDAAKFTSEFGTESVAIKFDYEESGEERFERCTAEYVPLVKPDGEKTGVFRALLPYWLSWPKTNKAVLVFGAPQETIDQYVADHPEERVESGGGWSFDLGVKEAAHLHMLLHYNAI